MQPPEHGRRGDVTELLAGHAGLSVRLMLIDRNVRLIEEGIDVAVPLGALAASALSAVRIGAGGAGDRRQPSRSGAA